MPSLFQLTAQATEDLDGIWWTIAADNPDAAERVETAILLSCRRLAKHPRMGIKRLDVTKLPVRFWTITKFPNHVIVYRPETIPLQVVAILHGRRNLKEALKNRT